jgi:hypothetical protein
MFSLRGCPLLLINKPQSSWTQQQAKRSTVIFSREGCTFADQTQYSRWKEVLVLFRFVAVELYATK